jgi:hypothetical protein
MLGLLLLAAIQEIEQAKIQEEEDELNEDEV